MLLGVNIDHIATVRQARLGRLPDPLEAARLADAAGADSIVCHLREDRRHIQDRDVFRLKGVVRRLNLEMSCAEGVVRVAGEVQPFEATLVPERRQELTTEGGLDLKKHGRRVGQVVARLQKRGIRVSLFIDPDERQIRLAQQLGAPYIELHTGEYANAATWAGRMRQLSRLIRAKALATRLGLGVNAGHGLDYDNVKGVASIGGIEELNIGHAIVARAVIVGIAPAVAEMKRLLVPPFNST